MRLSMIIIAVTLFGGVSQYFFNEEYRPKHIELKRIGCCQYIYNHDTKILMHHEGCDNLNHVE